MQGTVACTVNVANHSPRIFRRVALQGCCDGNIAPHTTSACMLCQHISPQLTATRSQNVPGGSGNAVETLSVAAHRRPGRISDPGVRSAIACRETTPVSISCMDLRGVDAKALVLSNSLRCCQLRVCDSVVGDEAENTVLLLLLLGDVEQRVSAVPAVIQQAICTAQGVHSSNLQQLQASCCPYSALPHVLFGRLTESLFLPARTES